MESRSLQPTRIMLPALTASAAEAVLNSLPHPVIVVGPNGEVCDANAAAEQFFDVSATLLRR